MDEVLLRSDLTVDQLTRMFSMMITPIPCAVRTCACGRHCPSNLHRCPECGRPEWCIR